MSASDQPSELEKALKQLGIAEGMRDAALDAFNMRGGAVLEAKWEKYKAEAIWLAADVAWRRAAEAEHPDTEDVKQLKSEKSTTYSDYSSAKAAYGTCAVAAAGRP